MTNMLENASFGDKFKVRGLGDDFVILWQKVKLHPWDVDHYRNKYKKEPPLREFVRYVTRDGEIRCVGMDGKSCDNPYYDIIGKFEK